jgi:hypothetical protein
MLHGKRTHPQQEAPVPANDIAWAVDDLNARAEGIRLRRNYFDGKHRTTIPQGKTLSRELRELLDDLNDNLCDDVVNEPVNRLSILTWTGKAQGIGTKAIESWEANRGDARSRVVHRNAWMAGDGFVIVQTDTEGTPRWYTQRPECMAVRYSAEYPDEIEVAAKVWREGKGWRLNLYYGPTPDFGMKPHLERYVTKGTNNDGAVPGAKSFQPVEATETPDGVLTEPVEVLDGDRIPVFHFPADEIGGYGSPAISNTVIGLQDVLNKSIVDMVVAMEAAALPDRWATGIQAEYDPVTGEERPIQKSGRERLLRTGSKDAAFGQFQQATMDPFLKTQAEYRLEIARKGYLPAYLVSSDAAASAPSGLSLLIAEGRLVKRVKTAQSDWGLVWREVQAFMLRLAGMAVQANDLEEAWAPAETRDEKALLEGLTMKVELGLPKRQALIEAGYDEDDVDDWLEEAQAKADAIAGGRVSAPAGSPLLPAVPNAPGGSAAVPAPPVQPAGAAVPTP